MKHEQPPPNAIPAPHAEVTYAQLHLNSTESTPWEYRLRRGRNWFFLGLLYAAYYLCRYNLSTVTPEIAREFNLSNQQIGWMSTGRDAGYAVGTFINGLFADALGGKQAMAIGALSTVGLNLFFGWFSTWDLGFVLVGLVVIRTLDGYGQSFGSPGMVKINTAWFRRPERGRFAGIFGGMIQLGVIGVNQLSALLLSGFSIAILGLGTVVLAQQNWRMMFIVPPIILAVILVLTWFNVKNHPEQAGFRVSHDDDDGGPPEAALPLWQVFVRIAGNPLIWVNAGAYMCTGFVRRAYDFWWAKYLDNVWHVGKGSDIFWHMGWLLPLAGFVGSFGAGVLSDNFFRSRRAPVAAGLYAAETLVIFGAIFVLAHTGWGTPVIASAFLVLISLTCNSSHSIIGTAVVMDIGGRKMAGFALGVVNSFQYVGAILAGFMLGTFIDKWGFNAVFYLMLPFSVLGTLLMLGATLATRGRAVRGA